MKKLLLLYACLLALASPLRAQTTAPDIVVVRIIDGMGGTVKAIITRGEGKSEKVEFDAGGNEKGLFQASEGYYKLIHSLYKEGYQLQSTVGSGGAFTFTLIFVKAKSS